MNTQQQQQKKAASIIANYLASTIRFLLLLLIFTLTNCTDRRVIAVLLRKYNIHVSLSIFSL